MANLVIVESPSKAATIKGYLGSNYKVIASKGHIRDLPKSSLGVDIENGFVPHYINIRGRGDVITQLKKEAHAANKIFLATDPDREGEAISWHLANVLGIPLSKECRVTFNEITKTAVKEAIRNPRRIDEDLVRISATRHLEHHSSRFRSIIRRAFPLAVKFVHRLESMHRPAVLKRVQFVPFSMLVRHRF